MYLLPERLKLNTLSNYSIIGYLIMLCIIPLSIVICLPLAS